MFNQDKLIGSVASHFYKQSEAQLVEPIARTMMAPMVVPTNVLQCDENLQRSTSMNFGTNLGSNDAILNCALTALINR